MLAVDVQDRQTGTGKRGGAVRYSFETKTGLNGGKICVIYEMDTDGEVSDLEVVHYVTGSNLFDYMSEVQIEQICDECTAHYAKAAKDHNTDLQINNFLGATQ